MGGECMHQTMLTFTKSLKSCFCISKSKLGSLEKNLTASHWASGFHALQAFVKMGSGHFKKLSQVTRIFQSKTSASYSGLLGSNCSM